MERELMTARLRKPSTTENKQLRNDLRVPAVLYGSHIDPQTISLDQADLSRFIRTHHVGSSLNLDVEGEEHLVILKDIQYHPVRGNILHLDFQALKAGEKVRITIPIFLTDQDQVHEDYIVQELTTEIEMSVLPQHLIDSISVSVAGKQAGDTLTIADLEINDDENFEIFSNPEQVIYTVMEAQEFQEPEVEDSDDLFAGDADAPAAEEAPEEETEE